MKASIVQYTEKEASIRVTFDQMKARLKEALDDKRDFEMELLQQ